MDDRGKTNTQPTLKGATHMLTAVVFWIVAFAFVLVTSINMIRRSIKTKHCTAETNAEVTEIKEILRRRNGVFMKEFTPHITYTIDGNTYSRKYTKAYHADTYYVGQVMPILYNPQKPEEVNTLGKSNNADLVVLVIGIVIGVIGVVILVLK